jgi:NADH-quinone oxidoreductase subunit J
VTIAWLAEHWVFLLSLLVSAFGVWWLMPRDRMRSRPVGLLLALSGCGLLAARLADAPGSYTQSVLFWMFATAAVACAILMVTSSNPIYAALWFALVTLSVCGLFLLQSAPFLAAATVIVYAGAIVVTFVFVIMLAQQSGAIVYDQNSRQPLAATLATFVLLGCLLYMLEAWGIERASAAAPPAAVSTTNPLSRPRGDERVGTMHGLGRSLFGDYLFAVELAGTLLLLATIGAVAIAPKRAQGTL